MFNAILEYLRLPDLADFYLPAFVEIGKIKVTNDNIDNNILD